jgi:hypothetical protein
MILGVKVNTTSLNYSDETAKVIDKEISIY